MKGLDRSDLVACREVEKVNYKGGKLTLVEYIPYGAIIDGDYGCKLYAIITNYDGSLIWQGGAEVCASLKTGLKRLKEYRKFLNSK